MHVQRHAAAALILAAQHNHIYEWWDPCRDTAVAHTAVEQQSGPGARSSRLHPPLLISSCYSPENEERKAERSQLHSSPKENIALCTPYLAPAQIMVWTGSLATVKHPLAIQVIGRCQKIIES